MKKTAAFAASIAMVTVMAVPAAAVDTPTSGESPAFVNVAEATLTKSIEITNIGGKDVYEPNITYSYDISSVTFSGEVAPTITGKIAGGTDTSTVTVKPGSEAGTGAVLLQYGTDAAAEHVDLVFGDDTSAKATPRTAEESFKIVTDNAAFTAAGVYRFQIKQDVDKKAAGVSDGTDSTADVFGGDQGTLFLDVYVKASDEEEPENPYEVYGLVLFKADGTNDANTSFNYSDAASEELKINELDPDVYNTYNVTVTKKIEGAMADKNHQFPFQIALANAFVTSGDEFTYASVEGETVGSAIKASLSEEGAYTFENLAFKDTQGIQIVGLPMGSTITVNETNNTADTYTAEVEMNGNALLEATQLASGASTAIGAQRIGVGAQPTVEEVTAPQVDEIIFTNTLDAVSPTGLIFRFAPFAFMVTAGGFLAAVALRGRKRDTEEGMI